MTPNWGNWSICSRVGQRDLHRLEEWATRNLTKYKDKLKMLHLGRKSSLKWHRGLRAALADSKQCMSKQCSSTKESQQSPKLYLQELRQHIEGLILSFGQSSTGNTLLNRKKLEGRAKSKCLLPYKGS